MRRLRRYGLSPLSPRALMRAVWRRLRSLWPPGLRAQLTAGYSVAFIILSVIIFGLSGAILRTTFLGSTQEQIGNRADQIATAIAFASNRACVQDLSLNLPDVRQSATLRPCPGARASAAQSVPADTTYDVRVLDINDRTLYASPSFSTLYVPAVSYEEPLRGQTWTGTIGASNDTSGALLLSVALVQNNQIFAILQVARRLDNTTAAKITRGIIPPYSFPLVVILCIIGGYFFAKRVTRPVHRLTDAALAIAGGDLRQRVPVPLARDDLQRMALTFNTMVERVEGAFIQQRRFVADASHELRTPVAVIRSMTDVALASDPSREECLALLRDVNAETERLSRLINSLLNLARADEGQLALDLEPARLDLVASDVVASVTPLASERGLSLAVKRFDPVTVSGDVGRLIQIILILVDNAINYTPQGGTITLAVSAVNGTARLAVHDTGIGIAPEDLQHIFERFYRADPARTRAAGGTGLGLALAAELARAHDGAIEVASRVGVGTTFTLVLPFAA